HSQVHDMRHFRAGRTEIIRPVTVQAVNFVTALVQGEATDDQFTEALTAQQDWIEAATAGKVFDRHLMMLEHIAQELGGAEADFFTENTKAKQHFLVTTTTGNTDVVVRSLAAPTDPHGFNISYAPVANGIEYSI